MGWGRKFLGDGGGKDALASLEARLADARTALDGADVVQDRRLEALEFEVDRLKLYVAAMMRLLIQGGVVDRVELQQVVDAIDREDGVVDGRMSRTPMRGVDGPTSGST